MCPKERKIGAKNQFSFLYKNFTLNGILVQARYCPGIHRRLLFFHFQAGVKRALPRHSERERKKHPECGIPPLKQESGNKKSVRISAPNASVSSFCKRSILFLSNSHNLRCCSHHCHSLRRYSIRRFEGRTSRSLP